jgi:hypothetical protein
MSYNVYRNNRAETYGGAVFVDESSKVQMDHELFYNNTSKNHGSAIFVDSESTPNKPSVLYMNNCTVTGNTTDSGTNTAMYVQASIAHVQNCIFWNNGKDFELYNEPSPAKLTVTYTLTQQGYAGTGNISADPLFANASGGDFHLRSKGGRYNPANGQFVIDATSSPAIDAGNPSSAYSNEPAPNGGRVNIGCYGNTTEASKSTGSGNESITQASWTMYPNPAKESVTISNLSSGSSVSIFDVTGRKVYGSVINGEQTTISTSNFINGIYIVQVTSNGTVSTQKLVVGK